MVGSTNIGGDTGASNSFFGSYRLGDSIMEKDYLQLALAHFNTDIPQWYGWRKDWTGEKRMSYET
jgi:hypothetical protein